MGVISRSARRQSDKRDDAESFVDEQRHGVDGSSRTGLWGSRLLNVGSRSPRWTHDRIAGTPAIAFPDYPGHFQIVQIQRFLCER